MCFEDAARDGLKKALVKTDVKNAHNSFPKDGAQKKIIEAANADSRLMPFAVAGATILHLATPIYTRFHITNEV